MTTGMPIATKCPKCMRGKYGFDIQIKGVQRVPGVAQRETWRRTGRRFGKVVKTLTQMRCNDCGHVWWTTLEAADRPWRPKGVSQ